MTGPTTNLATVGVCLMLLCLLLGSESVTVYRTLSGYRITSPVHSSRSCDRFCKKTCLMACGCEADCKSISVSQTLQACQLHQNFIYDEETEFTTSSDWNYHQVATDTVKKGEWTLVFRITSSIGQSALSTWHNSGNHDDHPVTKDGVPPGCASTNSSKSCDRHFRSTILDDWSSHNIQEVKLEVFKNGISQHNIVFDGTGSDVNSWMDMSKIISTTWTDLVGSTYNYFSIVGHTSRNFFINKEYDSCPRDYGWLAVINVELGLGCGWESRATAIPTIFFSSGTGGSLCNDYDIADVMAVFVKLG